MQIHLDDDDRRRRRRPMQSELSVAAASMQSDVEVALFLNESLAAEAFFELMDDGLIRSAQWIGPTAGAATIRPAPPSAMPPFTVATVRAAGSGASGGSAAAMPSPSPPPPAASDCSAPTAPRPSDHSGPRSGRAVERGTGGHGYRQEGGRPQRHGRGEPLECEGA